jgi:hypothetical protein
MIREGSTCERSPFGGLPPSAAGGDVAWRWNSSKRDRARPSPRGRRWPREARSDEGNPGFMQDCPARRPLHPATPRPPSPAVRGDAPISCKCEGPIPLDNLRKIFLYSITLAERQGLRPGRGGAGVGAVFERSGAAALVRALERSSAGPASPSCGGLWKQRRKPAECPRVARG